MALPGGRLGQQSLVVGKILRIAPTRNWEYSTLFGRGFAFQGRNEQHTRFDLSVADIYLKDGRNGQDLAYKRKLRKTRSTESDIARYVS